MCKVTRDVFQLEEDKELAKAAKKRAEQLRMRHLVAKGILESEKSYLHLIEQLVKVCLGFIILRSFSAGLGGSVGCAVRRDQEVAGSTPAEVGNILSWRLIMKYFLRSFSPFR